MDLFKISMHNGYMFKSCIDFLATCVPNKLGMKFSDAGINIYHTYDHKENNKYLIKCFLDKTGFTFFYFCKKSDDALCVVSDVKNLQKALRSIKKQDKIILTLKDEENPMITIKITSEKNPERVQTNQIPIDSISYEISNYKSLNEKLSEFSSDPFVLPSSELQQLKRTTGSKSTDVNLIMYSNKCLEFSSTWYNTGPFQTIIQRMPFDENDDKFQITLKGQIVTMLSKLSILSKNINIYQKSLGEKKELKISSAIDTPYYAGTIDMIISRV